MNAGKLFVSGLLFMTLGLTACGAVKDAKNAGNMQKEGNQRIATMNKESRALAIDHQIDLSNESSQESEAKDFDWTLKSPEQKAEIRKRLQEYSANASRILEIGSHKGMQLTGNTTSIVMRRDNADRYLASLKKHEGK